jgi:hypothetical protein
MNAVTAFSYDLAYLVEAVLGAIVRIESAAGSKTGPDHDEYRSPEKIFILRVEWAVDKYVTSGNHEVSPNSRPQ